MIVRLEAIWITFAIFSPIPSGLYSIGNDEHASTFEVQRKLKLLQNQSHDAIFFMLRILNENGVMNLHEKLTGSSAPHVKHPTIKVVSKAGLCLVSKAFSKRCIVIPPPKEPPLPSSDGDQVALLAKFVVGPLMPSVMGWEPSEVQGLELFH